LKKAFNKEKITMHAAGVILLTVNNLSKWVSANIREDHILLNNTSWSELHIPTTIQDRYWFTYHRSGYCLGWDTAEYQDQKMLTRLGGFAGISFHMSSMPSNKIGVVAFTNDNRASVLPHLMANYAYNLINELPADIIIERETKIFGKVFESENETAYPEDSNLLPASEKYDKLIGAYENTKNWPEIFIYRKNNHHNNKWVFFRGKNL